jgi:hypothetical protein
LASCRWLCTAGRKRAPSMLRGHCRWLVLAGGEGGVRCRLGPAQIDPFGAG